jgi:predicted RNA binding protein YcfA (HicA-like mRNA interferase family)
MRKLGKIKINIKEPTPTAAERLNQSQQAIRKAKGLPDPSHYKQMAAQKKAEIDSMKEEKQTELKPRNFVAKNAKTVGAGKHKDIRKMLKDVRGQKHKAKMEEEVEQLDELSKSTLGSYVKKASSSSHENSASNLASRAAYKLAKSDDSDAGEKDDRKSVMRSKSIGKAVDRLTKEEAEQLDEMPESSMKTRDVHAHLKSKGWAVARTSGGHDIYKHPKAKNIIAVPRHKQLKAPLIKGILKSSQVSEEVVEESFRIGGMGSRGGDRNYLYVRPEPKDGSELENIPSRPKTELQKRLKAALADVGEKLKQTHPKLKEALGDDITVFKKGSNVKQKIKASSYGAFKFHGFRKVAEAKDSQEYDYEGDMAKSDLRSIMHHAKELHDMIDDTTNLAEWCQSKITLAEDYLSTVANYMRSEMNEGAVPSKEETTKVRHHKSGKELVVTKRSVERYKQQGYHPVKEEVMSEDENDYRRKIEKNNKRFVAATKRQQNPLTNVHTAKEIEKRKQQKPVKESALEPTEGEMKGKQQMSRRAQIVKNAAKGKKSDNSDKFQKDPELSSEIHKT